MERTLKSILNPKIRYIEAVKNHFCKKHFYDSKSGYTMISFGFVTIGSAVITTDTDCFEVKAGELFAISPGCKYQSQWSGDPNIEFYSLHMQKEPDSEFSTFPIQKVEPLCNTDTEKEYSK